MVASTSIDNGAGGRNAPARRQERRGWPLVGASPRPESARTLPKRQQQRNGGKELVFRGFPRLWKTQTGRIRLRAASQTRSAPATKTVGKITSLIAAQPKYSSSWPEENEPAAMLPKIRKSL